ncbi:hypothetical protein ACFS5J_04505 [Flavobacterium chuncheonense]|uniref:Ig-like domain-containing protein n=1 Tax=Flavobacterium chuncheonense TaxID=2026653 RepID=A0ABW5YK48_9FLAO
MKSLIVFCVLVLMLQLSCKISSIASLDNDTESASKRILGVWVRENSISDKIEFLTNGQIKRYEDNILIYTDYYAITNTCNGIDSGNNQLFLQVIDSNDGSFTCDIINSVDDGGNGILSLTTAGQGKLVVYLKQ